MHDALMEAILAAPDDDGPRLVWADREGGERGELVVVECALARRDLVRDDRRRLRARREALVRAHPEWFLGLKGEFRRGFLERIEVPLATLGDAIMRAPLARELVITDPGPTLREDGPTVFDDAWARVESLFASAFATLPRGRIRALEARAYVDQVLEDFGGSGPDPFTRRSFVDRLVALVSRTPSLDALEAITISPAISAAGLHHLAALPSLERIVIDSDGVGTAHLLSLLTHCPKVTRLAINALATQSLTGDALSDFLARPETARLTELDLWLIGLRDDDAEQIACASSLGSLEVLRLSGGVRAAGATSIAGSRYLPKVVDLGVGWADEIFYVVLAASPLGARLRTLRVENPGLTERGVDALLSMPALEEVFLPNLTDTHRDALEAVIPYVGER